MIVTRLSPFWLSRGCTSLPCISRFARRLSPAANHPGIRMHHMQKMVYEYDVAIEERNGNMSRKCEMFLTLGAYWRTEK